jgi:hypothetical protein
LSLKKKPSCDFYKKKLYQLYSNFFMVAAGIQSQFHAVGLQGAALVGRPQISFFWMDVARHTNFAIVEHEQELSSQAFGSKTSCRLDRSADLWGGLFIKATFPGIMGTANSKYTVSTDLYPLQEPYWCHGAGFKLLTSIAVKISTNTVDTLFGDFMMVWEELSHKAGKALKEMVFNYDTTDEQMRRSRQSHLCYIPVALWFTLCSGLAMPLVACQFHSVSVEIQLARWQDLVVIPYTHVGNGSEVEAGADGLTSSGADALLTGGNDAQTAGMPANTTAASATLKTTSILYREDGQSWADCLTANVPLANSHLAISLESVYYYLTHTERCAFAKGGIEQLIPQLQAEDVHTISTSDVVQPTHTAASVTTHNAWLGDADVDGANALGENLHADVEQADLDAHPDYAVAGEPAHGTIAYAAQNVKFNTELFYNFPCMEYLFFFRKQSNEDANDWFNFSAGADPITGAPIDPLVSWSLNINGNSRLESRPGQYLRLVTNYRVHTNLPTGNKMIYCYPYCLAAEDVQPNGAMNSSKMDKVRVSGLVSRYAFHSAVKSTVGVPAQSKNSQLHMHNYTRNWNHVRFVKGMGGVKNGS